MRTLVMLYVRRFGIEDLLEEVGAGLSQAADEYPLPTKGFRRRLIDISTEIYALRNKEREYVRNYKPAVEMQGKSCYPLSWD